MEMRTEQPSVPLRSGAVPLAPTTRETAAIVGHFPPQRRPIGGSGLRVHPIALSGKDFGSTVSQAASVEILDAYASLGGNLVDTADSFGDGRSERIIGDWLRRRGLRDEFVVATKVGRSQAHPGLSASAISAAVDASLRRLTVERIDLLTLHLDDPEVPFEETLLAVDELIRAGKVRAFGMADHAAHRLLEARVACGLLGVAPLTALQCEYSLMHRAEFEGELARVAAQQGLAVLPRFPLAGGFLTGDYRGKADLVGLADAASLARRLGRRGRRVLAALDRVAAAQDAAVSTIALAWLLTKPGVVAPVVAVRTADDIFDVMSGPDIRLTRHQLGELDRASA